MPSKVYVDVASSAHLQELVKGTKNEGKAEMELDELYSIVNAIQKSTPKKGNNAPQVDLGKIMSECHVIRREYEEDPRLKDMSEMELMRLKADERKYQNSVKNIMNPDTGPT